MSIGRLFGNLRAAGLALTIVVTATAACGGGGGGGGGTSNTPCSSSSSAKWTAAQINAKTAPYHIDPVYDVPKGLTNCTIGFINPGKSIPFFQTWSAAMHAAAALYGVNFVEDDVKLKYENEATSFQTMSVQNLAVVGAHPGNPALLAATQSAKVPLITIDATVQGNPYSIGVPNQDVGAGAGQKLVAAAKDKLAGAWNGKTLDFVGLSAGGCQPCDDRINSGKAAVQGPLSIADSNVIVSEKTGTPTDSQNVMTNILTAHPKDVFVIVPLNDETAVGALHALDGAHRLGDALIVTLGDDKLGRDALRDPNYNNTLLGGYDFNPYGEAWDLIAAAVAIARGDKFKPYQVKVFLTPSTVNNSYPLPDNGV